MEEFSKLSIVDKSTSVAQIMQWIIPQSRLNQHCPFLEKEYPYYSTEFSLLHPTTSTEVKWKLQLERMNDKVGLHLLNLNEKDYFEIPAEVKNVGVRWTARLLSEQDDGPTRAPSGYMFYQKDYMEFATLMSYKDSRTEGRIICDLHSFESFAINGNFIVEVKIELERSQHEDKDWKISPYYDKPVMYPAFSISESGTPLYSHIGSHYSNPSLTMASQHPVPSHSCLPFQGHYNPRFACSTLNRSNKPNIVQAQLQQNFPHHSYRQQSFRHHNDHQQNRECFPSPVHTLRRSCSGRLHSSPSTSSTRSSSILDQDREWRTKTESREACDPDQIYSYIPDFFFSDTAKAPSINSVRSVQCSEYDNNSQRHQEGFRIKTGMEDDISSSDSNVPVTSKSISVTSVPSSIIECIYTGKAPDPTEILRHQRKFLELGLKHNLDMLVKECEKSYLHTLRVQNCLEIVLVVDNFLPQSGLKDEVIKFIRVNLKEVMKDPNWGKFVEYCSELVMEILSTEMDHHINV